MWLCQEHVGKLVTRPGLNGKFLVLRVGAILVDGELYVDGVLYQEDGVIIKGMSLFNTNDWELVQAPTTSFILED